MCDLDWAMAAINSICVEDAGNWAKPSIKLW